MVGRLSILLSNNTPASSYYNCDNDSTHTASIPGKMSCHHRLESIASSSLTSIDLAQLLQHPSAHHLPVIPTLNMHQTLGSWNLDITTLLTLN